MVAAEPAVVKLPSLAAVALMLMLMPGDDKNGYAVTHKRRQSTNCARTNFIRKNRFGGVYV